MNMPKPAFLSNSVSVTWRALATLIVFLAALNAQAATAARPKPPYERETTRQIVVAVNDAADLVKGKGEAAFDDFRVSDSRWRRGEAYIFVLDPDGTMLVHPDKALEGKNQIGLKDINGKPIIRGMINAVTMFPDKSEGWYHYEWPVPGGILPRWKSTYVRLATAPSGKRYIIGSGAYDDRMERAFVVDMVNDAVAQIEKNGESAYPLFHDRTGPFIAKRAYIFVFDSSGVDLVNPGFPTLEGRNLLDLKDTHGKRPIREMLKVGQTTGSGWVDYMWPKPGESASTQKSAYIRRAKIGTKWVLVGCGVYLADAPRSAPHGKQMTAPELTSLVREAAAAFQEAGEKAYPEFRKKGSKWFRDNTYFFVIGMDGMRVFLAPDPAGEGKDVTDLKDPMGRPFVKMIIQTAAGPSGEGWVQYMFPEPGDIFPAWKSTFVKRVTFPSGKQYAIGCGIYNMRMDNAFIEDLVNRASTLIAEHGKGAFSQLRDKAGPFMFMETYVFVDTVDGIEVVNGAEPGIEGRNILALRDLNGKALAREYIAAATKSGSAWVEYYWYKPGSNTPSRKQAYVRAVQSGKDTYIVGSGFYAGD